ncbi:Acyl transferase/acyl hydrolase/lysophospholipase [Penicillium cf. griseofulvum]|uniref:Acyl transferase/acyl hydrolase/lysophospholipase n=1 Tax=Penicillium cf. griseofulvum TaxID=2972120 RepID=A0A9W9JNT9_9EURO|nr:Acyl transferase/acyl hydrolase/lysophospholipase [Penicillium cf. griseofulvum]KAJ5450829.1 Acyl transferase/acyl hydrolase/lysophospholipase [Penicillium cf. griseofulvum]
MNEPVALVGMACRFAGASSPDQFWEMIEQGRTGHSPIPKRSFDANAWYHPSRQRLGSIITKSGFFIDDVSHFDAPFFSITASEAAAMDPMQRLALEISYEGFENAGFPMQKLSRSRTAVYSGVMTADYQDIAEGDMLHLGDHAATGTNKAILSNRISWFFDLIGPSLTLDTACSSGLYGLHLACQAIKAGECDQALVTGTNLILHPNLVSQYSSMKMIGPDGISHSFDASANGYGRGEGIACVVVKRLSDAIRDNDCIRAVIRNTGANHDGKTTSITIPNEDAQAALIRSTYQRAGLSLAETAYFEAHGTGTPQGDPIEMRAIAKTIGNARKNIGPLYVGSVKPNVGHTEGAAGIAGVIKAVLSLEAGVIPSVTGLRPVNPELHLSDWNLALPTENVPWPQKGPRRASVNSFGFGGSNAHAILEDSLHFLAFHNLIGHHSTTLYPKGTLPLFNVTSNPRDNPKQHHIFVLSAQERAGIARVASSYASFLASRSYSEKDTLSAMQSLSHILGTRRCSLDFRSFVVADSWVGLCEALEKPQALIVERVLPREKIVFVFTGQGAQRAGMAKELLSNPVFELSLQRCQKVLDECGAEWKIWDLLAATDGHRIASPQYAQPLCTAIQIALVDLLFSWGIEPAAVLGHSSGEIGAAYAAGTLPLEEAMYVAYYRGSFSTLVPFRLSEEGSMLAVGMSESEAEAYLVDAGYKVSVTIACINSPSSVTLSGTKTDITVMHEALVQDGKFSRILKTGVAYHSPHMAAIAPDVEQILRRLPERSSSPRVPMYSSVDEQLVGSEGLSRNYWMENMLKPVRFAGALRNLITAVSTTDPWNTEYSTILEIGPSKTLQGPIKQILAAISPRITQQLPYRSVLVAGQHATHTAMEAAGFLWATGHSVDLDRVNAIPTEGVALDILPHLPSYPWSHDNSFWHETTTSRAVRLRSQPRTDLLGIPVDGQNPFEPRWRNVISISENPWLADHNVAQACLYPAAGYLVMALEAMKSLTDGTKVLQGIELTNVTFETGLALSDDGSAAEVSLTFQPHPSIEDMFEFTVYSHPLEHSVRRLVRGSIAAICHSSQSDEVEEEALEQEWASSRAHLEGTQKLAEKEINAREFYAQLADIGLKYGPIFQGLNNITVSPEQGVACGTLAIPNSRSVMPMEFEYPHLLHPATLDCAFHLAFAALGAQEEMRQPAVPVSVDRIFISTDLPTGSGSLFTGMSSARRIEQSVVADILFTDPGASGPKILVESMRMDNVAGESALSNGLVTAKRSADLVWKEDISHVQDPSLDGQVWLKTWLECLFHKHSRANVLIVGASDLPSLYDARKSGHFTVVAVNVEGNVFERSNSPSHAIPPENMIQQKLSANSTYDVVIVDIRVSEKSQWLSELMSSILKPGGNVIMLGNSDQENGPSSNTWVNRLADEENYNRVHTFTPNSICMLTQSPAPPLSLNTAPDTWKLNGITILEQATGKRSANQIQLRESLAKLLNESGFSIQVVQWGDIPPRNTRIISLVEYDEPLFYNLEEAGLVRFRELIASSPGYMLWITAGGLLRPTRTEIHYAPTTGLLRTVRAEYPMLELAYLDLSQETQQTPSEAASIIADVLRTTLGVDGMETEFAEDNRKIFIPRLVENTAVDAELALYQGQAASLPLALENIHQTLRLVVEPSGSIYWTPVDASSVENIDPGRVLVSTRYTSIVHDMFRTVSSARNKRLSAYWTLAETLGVVEKVGSGVTDLQPGDLVLVESTSIETRLAKAALDVLKIPLNVVPRELAYWIGPLVVSYRLLMDFTHALSHPVSLSEKFSLETTRVNGQYSPPRSPRSGAQRPVQNILIDVEDASFRRVLVQMAQWLQVDTFVIIPPGEEQDTQDSWPVGCTVLTRMSRAVAKMISTKSPRRGIDLVFSSLKTMSNIPHILTSMAPNGQFIALDVDTNQQRALRGLVPRLDITLDCVDTTQLDPAGIREAQGAILQLLAKSAITLPPNPTGLYEQSVSGLDSVFDTPSSSNGKRRMVITFDPPSLIPIQFSTPIPVQLESTGTYILSGGLGSLGLEIASWIVNDHGARHIVFLSRSGIPSPTAAAKLDILAQQGCRCDVVRCDITSITAVKELGSHITKKGWDVRGVIQGAMVLADSPLETMTADKWATAAAPKIQGSWNLHEVLGQKLDFFVLLSSISGIIGNSAQANYSAGNTFEDALAAHRRSLGLPAISLNLGLVTDSRTANNVGGTNDVDYFLQKFSHLAPAVVSMREVQAALGAAIRGQGLNGVTLPPQVVVGISDRLHQAGSDDDLQRRWQFDPKFDHRVDKQASTTTAKQDKIDHAAAIRGAKTTEDARMVVENALRTNVASAISTDADNVDVEKPITAYGIDSLKATEVRNWVWKEFHSQLSIFDILSPMPISRLALTILKKSSLRESAMDVSE